MLAALMVSGVSIARPTYATGLADDEFWARKVAWREVADIVVAGDSRVYRGVSPSVMAESLPNREIRNFGFSAAGLSATYLDAASRVLKHDVGGTILLGVTPACLTEKSRANNGFLQWSRSPDTSLFMSTTFGDLYRRLRPIGLRQLSVVLRGLSGRYYEDYWVDGWVASRKEPVDIAVGVRAYRRTLPATRISEDSVTDLVEFVEREVDRGRQVIAFRPPVAPAMLEVEAGLSGLDFEDIRARTRSAGATWLTPPTSLELSTYDGSHLDEGSAIRLSRWLGDALQSTTQ